MLITTCNFAYLLQDVKWREQGRSKCWVHLRVNRFMKREKLKITNWKRVTRRSPGGKEHYVIGRF